LTFRATRILDTKKSQINATIIKAYFYDKILGADPLKICPYLREKGFTTRRFAVIVSKDKNTLIGASTGRYERNRGERKISG
jgi:hypothetical protein